MRLDKKVVVVTRAGSGIGRAMVELFTSEGAKVVAAEWNKDSLDKVVSEVTNAGGDIIGIQGDVSNIEDDRAIIQLAISTYGRIDVFS